MVTITGLLRDVVVATFGLLLLFGVSVTSEQSAAVAALIAAGIGFGTYLYQALHGRAFGPEGIGLLRDFGAAALAVGVLFGLKVTTEQIGAVLVLLTTVAALVQWVLTAGRTRALAPAAPL